MDDWRIIFEGIVSIEYPGVTIKWNGDDPPLVIPDALENKASEIMEYVTAFWAVMGGKVELFTGQAVHTPD